MANSKPSKKALKRRKQRLKHQLSIMNSKTAIQHQKVPIENQLQKDEIIIVDEIASKSTAIDDQRIISQAREYNDSRSHQSMFRERETQESLICTEKYSSIKN